MIAVFLDRDGTIGGTGGGVHPNDFKLFPQSAKAIRLLNQAGILVFLFTNQSRVGRGYFLEEDLIKGFREMESELAESNAFFDEIYYCPHSPIDKCECQKPNIGLLLQAKEEHGLDLKRSYVVGDTGESDMLAADRVGMKKVLVETGWGRSSLTTFRATWSEVEPDFIAPEIREAVNWILQDKFSE
ncbi:D-glycero-alpha-D-manno-heptose-1,7-bisphosphate 7-phosphatase [Chryseomicrobium aureum]|uniref:D-glycero-alpha-D-manno-heptose-1,7-bisphosphate 7-phosphatase n=1 Tax=Chryseomicrobium aureum TaxID=1441723 RepID=UPI00370D32A0